MHDAKTHDARSPNPISVVIDNKTEGGKTIVKVEQWSNPQPLSLLEVMQKLVGMDLWVLKAVHSSSTDLITQYFEVADCNGSKVHDERLIGNMRKVLSFPVEMKWMTDSLERPIDANTMVEMHVIELILVERPGVFVDFLAILAEMNCRVHRAGCWIRKGRVACVMYVEGAKMDGFLWELRNEARYRFGYVYDFKIIVCKVAGEDFTHLSGRLENLMLIDFEVPQSLSDIHIHQGSADCYYSVDVICLNSPKLLFNVSCTLADLNYKIRRASIRYPRPNAFLRGRTRMREDIYKETLGDFEKILEEAIERRCPKGSMQLTVGSREEFELDQTLRGEYFNDLTRSLRENGLSVTSGHVSCSKQTMFSAGLIFFVTDVSGHSENPVGEAG